MDIIDPNVVLSLFQTRSTEITNSYDQIYQENFSRNQEEIAIINGSSRCLQNDFYSRIYGLDFETLDYYLEKYFYDHDLMLVMNCLVNTAVENHNDYYNVRDKIRSWLIDLLRIGSASTYGKAFLTDFRQTHQPFVLKAPQDPQDQSPTHELFVGLLGTNKLREVIPNFAYIYGGFNCSTPFVSTNKEVITWCDSSQGVQYIVYENIAPSISFRQSLKTASVTDIASNFMQTILALLVAEQTIGFTHYDLHTENILLRDIGDPNSFYIPYTIAIGSDGTQTVFVRAKRVVTMIDYGFAHIVVDGKSYGNPINATVYKRTHPLSDAFKLLMFIYRDLMDLKRYNELNQLESLLNFFNLKSPIGDLVKKLFPSRYYVPIELAGELTLTNYYQYLKGLAFEYGLTTTPEPGVRVLGCAGTDPCYKFAELEQVLDLDKFTLPTTSMDFQVLHGDLLKNHKDEMVKQLTVGFDPTKAVVASRRQLVILSQRLADQVAAFKANPYKTVRYYPPDLLSDPTIRSNYIAYVEEVGSAYETLEKIEAETQALEYLFNIYYPNQQLLIRQLTSLNVGALSRELEVAINSIAEDYNYIVEWKSKELLSIEGRNSWYYYDLRDFLDNVPNARTFSESGIPSL